MGRLLDEILNRKPNQHLPYVGAAAFSHKGGLHVSAVQKNPKTYEHINPEDVGNSRNIVVSDQSGKSNIISRLKSIKIDIEDNGPVNALDNAIRQNVDRLAKYSKYLKDLK